LLPSIESDDRNLTWLRRPIGSPGAKGMLDLIDRLEFIRAIELKPGCGERD
jgi:hypothetical protein